MPTLYTDTDKTATLQQQQWIEPSFFRSTIKTLQALCLYVIRFFPGWKKKITQKTMAKWFDATRSKSLRCFSISCQFDGVIVNDESSFTLNAHWAHFSISMLLSWVHAMKRVLDNDYIVSSADQCNGREEKK